jgi:hypothetical protein
MGNPIEPPTPVTMNNVLSNPVLAGARKNPHPARKRLRKVVTMMKTIWKPRSDMP